MGLKNNSPEIEGQKKPGRGGARPGAGRKRGSPNKATQARQAAVAASGLTPLDYMLKVMRDPKADTARRDSMATASAPYVHPRLQAVQVSGDPSNPVVFQMINRPAKEKR